MAITLTSTHKIWLTRIMVAASVSTILLIATLHAQADEGELTLELRPHCEDGYDADTWIYGGAPATGWTLDPFDPERCADFPVRDPQTRETDALQPGDILDLDVVVRNPEEIQVSLVGAWLEYDDAILEGLPPIETFDQFPNVTPGQSDFRASEGQARIEVSAEDPDVAPDSYWIPVARLRFRVKATSLTATPITFYDDQPNGKTHVETTEQSDEGHEVTLPSLGTLMVRIAGTSTSSTAATNSGTGLPRDSTCENDHECESHLCHLFTCQDASFRLAEGNPCRQDEQCQSGLCDAGICGPEDEIAPSEGMEGDLCTYSTDCESGICYEGTCQSIDFLIPNGGDCQEDDQCQSGTCTNGTCGTATVASSSRAASFAPSVLPNGSRCSSHGQCGSGFCQNGICSEMSSTLVCTTVDDCSAGEDCIDGTCVEIGPLGATGASCTQHTECQSGICLQGVCQEINTPEVTGPTAFALLQLKNLRVTTAGDAAFLAWDPLQFSRLKGYNIYYGTTAGQYIQRKTVPGTATSIALRGLPEGTQYFFAVKAVSTSDEESAFSLEVSVVIGDPTTSSSPLSLSQLDASVGGNPVSGSTDVPGETGPSSMIALLGLLSASIGTVFAARRQTLLR